MPLNGGHVTVGVALDADPVATAAQVADCPGSSRKLAYDAPEMNATLRQALFDIGPQIRYVAFGEGQRVETAQRDGIADASDASSDFFEELLVNPTLLTLARQRGELDCGGLRHVIVAYGNFNQVVVPAPWGHVSVCVERDAEAEVVARQVALLIEQTQ